LGGTTTAAADIEFASPDWLLDGEPLSSSDTVGMAVGVEADPQAVRRRAITIIINNLFEREALRLQD